MSAGQTNLNGVLKKMLWTAFLFSILCSPSSVFSAFSFFDPTNDALIPATLSAAGLYTGKVVSSDAVPYQVNIPIWKDGLSAEYYVLVPAGKTITYVDTDDLYGLPDGIFFVRTYGYDTIVGNAASHIYVETQLSSMYTEASGQSWKGWRYRWRQDQTDADLVTLPEFLPLDTILSEWKDGVMYPRKHQFSDYYYCLGCHQGRNVLGFYTAQLNRPSITNPAVNQITDFFNKNIFTGTPPDVTKSPKWPAAQDTTATLEVRARSYLAGNCSHCHGTRGHVEGPEINLDYYNMVPQGVEFIDMASTWSNDQCSDMRLIKSGDANASSLYVRQTIRSEDFEMPFSSDADQMPQTETFKVDTTGLKVLEKWICSLNTAVCAVEGCPAPVNDPGIHRSSFGSPELKGRVIYMPEGYLPGHTIVELFDIAGKKLEINRIRHGQYTIRDSYHSGLYLIKINGQCHLRFVL